MERKMTIVENTLGQVLLPQRLVPFKDFHARNAQAAASQNTILGSMVDAETIRNAPDGKMVECVQVFGPIYGRTIAVAMIDELLEDDMPKPDHTV